MISIEVEARALVAVEARSGLLEVVDHVAGTRRLRPKRGFPGALDGEPTSPCVGCHRLSELSLKALVERVRAEPRQTGAPGRDLACGVRARGDVKDMMLALRSQRI